MPRKNKIKKRILNKKYFDLWSIVHFLSGFLLFIVFENLGASLVVGFIYTLNLLILWEIFEWIIKIGEHMKNLLSDIILGMAGFIFAFLVFPYIFAYQWEVFINILALIIVLDVVGYMDYKSRAQK